MIPLRNLRAELASIEPDDELARDSLARLTAEIPSYLPRLPAVDAGPRHGLREAGEFPGLL